MVKEGLLVQDGAVTCVAVSAQADDPRIFPKTADEIKAMWPLQDERGAPRWRLAQDGKTFELIPKAETKVPASARYATWKELKLLEFLQTEPDLKDDPDLTAVVAKDLEQKRAEYAALTE